MATKKNSGRSSSRSLNPIWVQSVGKEHRFLMANDIMGIFNKAGI